MSRISSARRLMLIAGISLPVAGWAGRPVIRDVSLSELTQASAIIAEVTHAGHERTLKGVSGCDSREWDLTVVAILRQGSGTRVQAGDRIRVRYNVIAFEDCVLRSGGKTTGASFPAVRYKPLGPDAPRHERFIVFLKPGDGPFTLVAEAGFESSSKQAEIADLAGRGSRPSR